MAIFEKLKAPDSSRWAAMRVTWAGMRQRKEVAHIEGRLAEYRMEMNTRLLALLNINTCGNSEHQSSVKKQLDNIQSEAQTMSLSSSGELKSLRVDFVKILAKLDEDCSAMMRVRAAQLRHQMMVSIMNKSQEMSKNIISTPLMKYLSRLSI
ncbi:hypothetical protein BDP55DRAFT_715042 [Colletotrichum godetiae]|uniref:Uncharacterized protein n=1 Tax=Colletotrichum godetiae TaxID=1209918 RepID=A0AAJ0EYL7_9PEZI|nr:uncharacterized protein BDP55DRAFT_715042 [Colletotrichum godetiae]KAK1676345.1 hypothetical protein BDP55DRAFT_715042 [Colletotrichum godetiae]